MTQFCGLRSTGVNINLFPEPHCFYAKSDTYADRMIACVKVKKALLNIVEVDGLLAERKRFVGGGGLNSASLLKLYFIEAVTIRYQKNVHMEVFLNDMFHV